MGWRNGIEVASRSRATWGPVHGFGVGVARVVLPSEEAARTARGAVGGQSHAEFGPVAQWQSTGLIPPGSQVRILPGPPVAVAIRARNGRGCCPLRSRAVLVYFARNRRRSFVLYVHIEAAGGSHHRVEYQQRQRSRRPGVRAADVKP